MAAAPVDVLDSEVEPDVEEAGLDEVSEIEGSPEEELDELAVVPVDVAELDVPFDAGEEAVALDAVPLEVSVAVAEVGNDALLEAGAPEVAAPSAPSLGAGGAWQPASRTAARSAATATRSAPVTPP